MVRVAHEVRDVPAYIDGVHNVEFKRPPPLWCDRASGQIKANAALVHGGILAGHITPELPKKFPPHVGGLRHRQPREEDPTVHEERQPTRRTISSSTGTMIYSARR
jgi:hypothetical protein